MPFVPATRLHMPSWRFFPGFLAHTLDDSKPTVDVRVLRCQRTKE
jgi:hypothetical protein